MLTVASPAVAGGLRPGSGVVAAAGRQRGALDQV